jgi:hypothetical protein
VNFGSEFCVFDECCSFNFAIQQMKLLSDHLCIMFHLRMQRKDGDHNVCRYLIRVTGAKLPVFRSLENAHFGTCRTLVLDGFLDSSHTNLIEA